MRRAWLTELVNEARATAAATPAEKPAELLIPEETMRKLLAHPWASTLLPQVYGDYFQNPQTGACFFRAVTTESVVRAFMAGVKRLEPQD